MNKSLGIVRRRVIEVLLIIAVVLPFTFSNAIAAPDDEYKKLPGYVDFDAMGIFGNAEPKVEVFLRGPLLKMAIEALRHEDPELVDVLAGIQLVRVHVFDSLDYDDMKDKTESAVRTLEKKGWELAVRVREHDESITIHMLPGKNDETLEGLVVMVVEGDDEAVFVNIVGTLNVKDIGRIVNAFDDDIRIHISDDDDDDDDEEAAKRRKKRAYNP
ncbi:MAG: DUF4252 domain-containing protein [bacterium]|nr:DUF4252 domain-containing protein [bacterium]